MQLAIAFDDCLTTRERAEEWMVRYPHVVSMFENFALELANKGRRFGINLLRERVRWHCIYDYGNEKFKFQNSFSPFVARELIRRHPHLSAYMRCKATRS